MVSCRLCGAALSETFIDLGKSPPCESFLTGASSTRPSASTRSTSGSPASVCRPARGLRPRREIFPSTPFSAYSDSWVEHARVYADAMVERFDAPGPSLVSSSRSNDGYLLQHFVADGDPVARHRSGGERRQGRETRGVRRLSSSSTPSSPDDWRRKSGATWSSRTTSRPGSRAQRLRRGDRDRARHHGVLTIEVPHLVRLIEGLQFDTIYHEHYSYFSLTTLGRSWRQGWRSSTSRSSVPRRLPPRVRQAPRRRRRTDEPRRRAPRRESGGGYAARGYRTSPGVDETKRSCSSS